MTTRVAAEKDLASYELRGQFSARSYDQEAFAVPASQGIWSCGCKEALL